METGFSNPRKTCAYCWEDIHEKAVACRYCARPVLNLAQRVSLLGQWYAAGSTPDGWAIWNMTTGGNPVREVEQTDEGWQKVWKEYQKLETPPPNVSWMIGGFVPLDW